MNTYYKLGQLFAALAMADTREDSDPEAAVNLVPEKPSDLLSYITRQTISNPESIEKYMAAIPADASWGEALEGEGGAHFWLAYWHERVRIRTSAPLPIDSELAKLDDRMEIRIDSETKAWLMQNGGATFVRQIIAEYKGRVKL